MKLTNIKIIPPIISVNHLKKYPRPSIRHIRPFLTDGSLVWVIL